MLQDIAQVPASFVLLYNAENVIKSSHITWAKLDFAQRITKQDYSDLFTVAKIKNIYLQSKFTTSE